MTTGASAPSVSSWVDGADASGFPLANLPYGVASRADGVAFVAVAIGGHVLDLTAALAAGLLGGVPAIDYAAGSLNPLLAAGRDAHRSLRARLTALLGVDAVAAEREAVAACLVPVDEIRLHNPVAPGDFVDFYSSMHHALRAMRTRDPNAALHPNWTSLPVGYHSRTGGIVGTDAPIYRPRGQFPSGDTIVFAPTRALDYEVEIGFLLHTGSPRGTAIGVDGFEEHVFGLLLLNDWSARDIQRWETVPLGPNLAKSFATQAGPWVVPLEALADARRPNPHAADALPHLRHHAPHLFDIALDVSLSSAAMRVSGAAPVTICRSNGTDLYWDGAQQLAHMTSNGAPSRSGDLFGSGTVSGATDDAAGCLLERTGGGKPVLALPDGTHRGYFEDGDEVRITATAPGPGGTRLSFGTLSGTVAAPL